jgi:hypothetical protein
MTVKQITSPAELVEALGIQHKIAEHGIGWRGDTRASLLDVVEFGKGRQLFLAKSVAYEEATRVGTCSVDSYLERMLERARIRTRVGMVGRVGHPRRRYYGIAEVDAEGHKIPAVRADVQEIGTLLFDTQHGVSPRMRYKLGRLR